MIVDSRPLRAITAGLLLAGCTAANVKPQPPAASAERSDRTCLTATGSRIDAPCSAIGRAYSGEDIQRTGWWKDGQAPGATAGAVLIAGHVDSAKAGAGAFFRLATARRGDVVEAEHHFRAALARRPGFAPSVTGLAQALRGQGRIAEANA